MVVAMVVVQVLLLFAVFFCLAAISVEKLEVQTSRLPKFFRGGSSKTLTIPMSHVVDCSLVTDRVEAAHEALIDQSDRPLSKVQFTVSYLVSLPIDIYTLYLRTPSR